MASDDEIEALKGRIEALERHHSGERLAGQPTADEIQAYLKVQQALVGKPDALSADEIQAFQKVRDHLLATGFFGNGPIGACGGSREFTGLLGNGPIGACGGSRELTGHGHAAPPVERFSGLGK